MRTEGAAVPQNNVMQLTKGGWMRMEASSSARVIVNGPRSVRPSQLITSVGPTRRGRGEAFERLAERGWASHYL